MRYTVPAAKMTAGPEATARWKEIKRPTNTDAMPIATANRQSETTRRTQKRAAAAGKIIRPTDSNVPRA
jgi:hypothetical protein